MHLGERHVNEVAIVDISSDSTSPGSEIAGALRDLILALVARGERRIVVNVANLLYVDSSFVGELVVSYRAAAAKEAALVLAHPSPQLQSVLRTTTLDTILKAYATEAEAIARLTEPCRS
jgi:anti-sigma B factor antagonist